MSYSTLKRKTPLKNKGGFLRRTPFKKKPSARLTDSGEEGGTRQRKAADKAQEPKKADLVKRLDKVFSLYVRLRDAMYGGKTRCISCGQVFPFEVMQAGHYIPRRHMSVRFDPMNVHSQCPRCNCEESGNLEAYKERLIKKIGEDGFDELMEKAREERKWSEDELKEAIAMCKAVVRKLSKEKGISVKV